MALHFINNDFKSSVETPLTMTNTAPLHVTRMKQMAGEIYKTANKTASKRSNISEKNLTIIS